MHYCINALRRNFLVTIGWCASLVSIVLLANSSIYALVKVALAGLKRNATGKNGAKKVLAAWNALWAVLSAKQGSIGGAITYMCTPPEPSRAFAHRASVFQGIVMRTMLIETMRAIQT